MMVRCGACRTQFDVPGPGRFSCPNCGSVNMVRGAADAPTAPPGMGAQGGPPPGYGQQPAGYPPPAPTPPPPPAPEPPSPKIECSECEFTFIVGQIEVATCPNCGAEVETGWTPNGA